MGVLLPSSWGDLSHLTAGWTCWCNTHITAGCRFSTSSPVTQPSCALSEDTPCLTPQPAPGADCGRTRRKTFFWFSLNVHVATSRIRHRNPRHWTWVQWSAGVHGHLLLLQRSVPSRPIHHCALDQLQGACTFFTTHFNTAQVEFSKLLSWDSPEITHDKRII